MRSTLYEPRLSPEAVPVAVVSMRISFELVEVKKVGPDWAPFGATTGAAMGTSNEPRAKPTFWTEPIVLVPFMNDIFTPDTPAAAGAVQYTLIP